jgi:diguanylate cyclase (GGDEF)-like protein
MIIWLFAITTSPSFASKFELTSAEKNFLDSIRERPIIIAYSFDVLYSRRPDGEERGMLVPLIAFLRDDLGLYVELRKIDWQQALSMRDGQSVDFFSLIHLTEAARWKYHTSIPIFRANVQIVSRRKDPIMNPLGLQNRRIGILYGNILREGIESYLYPEGTAVYYGSITEMLNALENRDIDCILATSNTEIEILGRDALRYEFSDQNFYTDQGLITEVDALKPLVDILNRFLATAMGDDLKAAVAQARLDAIFSFERERFAGEIARLQERYQEVKMIDDCDMYPLSYMKNEQRKGLIVEINEVFEELTGLEIVSQKLDESNDSTTSVGDRIRSGRAHLALDFYTNPEFARDLTLAFSTPVWTDSIRTYSYKAAGKTNLNTARVGTNMNGLTYVNWDVKAGNRPKIFNSRSAVLSALKNDEIDVAFISEMTFNYQYTILKDYKLREFDYTDATVAVEIMQGARNDDLNRLYNESILLHQALYPQSRSRWEHVADRYKSDYMRLRESRRTTLQAVTVIISLLSATLLYSFYRLVRYDRQISRLIRKQQTFDLVWGNLKTGRLTSKGDNPIFRNWGFEIPTTDLTIGKMSEILGLGLRMEYTAELENMRKNGVDMTTSQKMLVSPKDGGKRYYRRYLHYLNENEFMECLQDVTDEIDKLDTLSAAASTDFLSTLLTRRAMNDKLLQKCGELQEKGGRTFVFMLDIDDFKKVNDSYGHDAGDEVLKNVSLIIKDIVGSSGSTARWGGEEFLVMLDCNDIEAAKECAWAIVRAVEASEVTIKGTDKKIKTTISAGMAELHPGKHYNVSVHFSDNALYDAKQSGKNCVRVWNAHLRRSV